MWYQSCKLYTGMVYILHFLELCIDHTKKQKPLTRCRNNSQLNWHGLFLHYNYCYLVSIKHINTEPQEKLSWICIIIYYMYVYLTEFAKRCPKWTQTQSWHPECSGQPLASRLANHACMHATLNTPAGCYVNTEPSNRVQQLMPCLHLGFLPR